MAVQPKCPICGNYIMRNGGKDPDGKVLEAQTSYWMHDPRNTHVDVLVVAHTVCFDKAQIAKPNFHLPTQDYTTMRYPTSTTVGGTVTMKTLSQYQTLSIV